MGWFIVVVAAIGLAWWLFQGLLKSLALIVLVIVLLALVVNFARGAGPGSSKRYGGYRRTGSGFKSFGGSGGSRKSRSGSGRSKHSGSSKSSRSSFKGSKHSGSSRKGGMGGKIRK